MDAPSTWINPGHDPTRNGRLSAAGFNQGWKVKMRIFARTKMRISKNKVVQGLGLATLMCFSSMSQAQPAEVDAIAAIVNEKVILQSEVDEMLSSVQRTNQGAGLDPVSLRSQVLDRLILDSLRLQMAEQIGLQVSDAQLEQALENYAAQQGKTLEQVRREAEIEHGSYSRFRELVRDEITASEITRIQVRQRINISEQEVDKLVEEMLAHSDQEQKFKIRHLMLRVPEGADPDTLNRVRDEILAIMDEVRGGADFGRIALERSQGPKALEGGDWGWMNVNEMPTLFAESVQGEEKGAIIGPLRSGSGFSIVMVEDIQGEELVFTEEVNSRHILIKPSIILSDAKAKSLLDDLYQRILSGEDFAELATTFSEDPGSAVKGGELGWARPQMYVPEFAQAVTELPVGQVSRPFRTMHGWHIVEVLDRRSMDTTAEAQRDRAYQLLFNRRFNEETEAWMNELKGEAYVRVLDPQTRQPVAEQEQ